MITKVSDNFWFWGIGGTRTFTSLMVLLRTLLFWDPSFCPNCLDTWDNKFLFPFNLQCVLTSFTLTYKLLILLFIWPLLTDLSWLTNRKGREERSKNKGQGKCGHMGQIISYFIAGRTAKQDPWLIIWLSAWPRNVCTLNGSIDMGLLQAESYWRLRIQGSQSYTLDYRC